MDQCSLNETKINQRMNESITFRRFIRVKDKNRLRLLAIEL